VIRVGLAGYGLAGSVFHAPLIRACQRMQLSAVLTSRDVPQRVGTFDELLEQSDLVVVATPNTTHFEMAAAALKAGKHVVVDKPLTVTLGEADELIALARERQRLLTVFHNRRWDSDFLTVRKLLRQLSEVMLFEAHWDRFRPEIKRGWREEPQPGGGVLSDLGPHMIDQALVLFGMSDAVSADVLAQRPGAEVDDYFDLTLHYGERRLCLRCSSLVAQPRPRFAIHGAAASFVKYGLDPQEAQLKSGMDPRDAGFAVDANDGALTFGDGRHVKVPSERGNYLAFYEAVADAILDGAPVPVDPADARAGLVLIDLARRAAAEGRRLPVPAASSTGASAPAARPSRCRGGHARIRQLRSGSRRARSAIAAPHCQRWREAADRWSH
jgi:scyllo-inositol 2-dehydrogenase (NADP+)